jgi:L-fuconolactonase
VLAMLLRVVEAFGKERVMWGSDTTQTVGHHSWAESLYYIRDTPELSDDEKRWILGGSLRKVLDWPGPPTTPT